DHTNLTGKPISTKSSPSILLLREKISKNFAKRHEKKLRAIKPSEDSFDVLLLSAGGQYGAYGSGFLKGWSENVQLTPRDSIDIVTGVSTGAMMATYVFLGSSDDPMVRAKYDDLLEKEYTTLQDKDVFRSRFFLELLWANSIYDSEPLRKRFENIITESLLDELVAEADKNDRQLFVGAVNTDSGEFEVFDLVAIARDKSQDRRACYTAAVLASAAIPATFDAIFINGNMYIDGGIRKQGFFVEQVAKALPNVRVKKIFGILHGNLDVPPAKPDNNLIGVISRTVSITNDELLIDSAFYVDTKGKDNGFTRFWTAPVKSTCETTSPEGHKFDPVFGTCLWNKGYDDAKQPKPWKTLDDLLQQ
ncbi:MAG TPA: patatin-like phospholipase family protein, partial [Syntrophales bacterium]|nr:patatin-like phospholipase family protein [Syntrophales bacterium]